jgi:hypothetical protein
MYRFSLQELQERLEKIEERIELQEDGFEEEAKEFESDIETEIEALLSHLQNSPIDKSQKLYDTLDQLQSMDERIKKLKGESDFYDEDAELDSMFPDRHDEDFDEESM